MSDRETASVQGEDEPEPTVPAPSDEATYDPEDGTTEVLCGMCRATGVDGEFACQWCDGTRTVLALGEWCSGLRARAEGEAALLKHGDNLTTATIWSEGYQAGEAARTAEIVADLETWIEAKRPKSDDGVLGEFANGAAFALDRLGEKLAALAAHFNPEADQ